MKLTERQKKINKHRKHFLKRVFLRIENNRSKTEDQGDIQEADLCPCDIKSDTTWSMGYFDLDLCDE